MVHKDTSLRPLVYKEFTHLPEVVYGQEKEAKKRILLSQKFKVEEGESGQTSLMIDITSDFIGGDVNFYLETDQGHFIQPSLTTER